ncbi:hypothetical protein D3C80_2204780 [compost metagenome]
MIAELSFNAVYIPSPLLTAIKITGIKSAGIRLIVLKLRTPRMLRPAQKISTPPTIEVSVSKDGVIKSDKI